MRERILGLDLVAVLAFVIIGRRSHEEGLAMSGLVRTALPFVIALGLSWGLVRAWVRPARVSTGLAVAVLTVAIGMILRRWVVGDGTAPSFVIVASVFLVVTLSGWRVIYRRVVSPAT